MLPRVKCPVVGLAELEVFGRESLLVDVVTGQWIEGVSIDIGLFYKFYTIFFPYKFVSWIVDCRSCIC